MKSRTIIVSLLTGLIVCPFMETSAEAPAVTIQVFATFDYPGAGNLTRPQKVNDRGDIIGIYLDPSLVSRGFIRFNNGRFSDPIIDPNDTGNITEGRGINQSRLACGDYFDGSSGTYHGFFLNRDTFINYDVPGSITTEVLGINNAGDFAGGFTPSGGITQAYVSIGGVITSISISDASASFAYQINSSNQACGYYSDNAGITHGFAWNSDGTLQAPIDPPGSTSTIIFGNNDRNWLVGRYTDASGITHGLFVQLPNQFITFDYPGSTFTSFNGINKTGVICGRYLDSSGIEHGLVLRANGGSASQPEVRTLPQTLAVPLSPSQPQPSIPRPTVPAS